MSTISFGGLASGLDTNAIIDGMMAAERIPLSAIQKKQAEYTAAQTTINGFSSKLSALKSAAQALSTSLGFSAYKASSSDSAVVATVTGAAAAGSYDVTVTQLAKEERRYSDAQTSSTADLNLAGTLSLQVGSGTSVDLTIEAGDSLTDIATKINSSGLRVGASVVYDGTSYKLALRGLDSGAANALTVTETGFSTGLSNVANRVQSAQDAMLVIDQQPITRSTNQIVGVIPGVTLALSKQTTTPAKVGVESDPQALKEKVAAFIKAFNDVVGAGHFAAGYGSTKASNDQLAGDSTIRTVLDRLSRSVGSAVPGTSGKYTTLASIGLKSTKDGALELDDTKFSAALQSDPASVARLFVNDSTLGSTGAMTGVMTLVEKVATNPDALLKTKSESLGKTATRLGDDAAALERRLDLIEQQMRQRFTQLEMLMTQFKAQGNALSAIAMPKST